MPNLFVRMIPARSLTLGATLLVVVGCATSPGGSSTPVGSASADPLQALADENGSGVILAYGTSAGLESAAAGADGDGSAIAPESAWWVGSVAKMITATAILQLVDAGEVALDSPAAAYLEGSVSDAFTIRQLLQMRSGVPGTSEHIGACPSAGIVQTALDLAAEPKFEPGSRFDYEDELHPAWAGHPDGHGERPRDGHPKRHLRSTRHG